MEFTWIVFEVTTPTYDASGRYRQPKLRLKRQGKMLFLHSFIQKENKRYKVEVSIINVQW